MSTSRSFAREVRLTAVSLLACVALFAPLWFDGFEAVAVSAGAAIACVLLFGLNLLSRARELSDEGLAGRGTELERLRTPSREHEKA